MQLSVAYRATRPYSNGESVEHCYEYAFAETLNDLYKTVSVWTCRPRNGCDEVKVVMMVKPLLRGARR
jgi:hypothetical protein